MLFHAARQPDHIVRTLQRVYFDKSQVDEALIESILSPSRTPEAELAGPMLFCSLFLAPIGRTWEQLVSFRPLTPLLLPLGSAVSHACAWCAVFPLRSLLFVSWAALAKSARAEMVLTEEGIGS